ncbi:MAG: hypothetical protein ACK5PP_09195 [Acidimicrobiales bacterium]
MAEAPADLVLDSLRGDGYPLQDWLTSYPLLLVALDPYTIESSWIIETGARLLHHFSPSDVRVGWIATADDDGCRQFLGPWAERFLTFPDPDRKLVEAFGAERLPSLVFVRSDGWVDVANGWDPDQWKQITGWLAKMLRWSMPIIPGPGDPTPYVGTPAKGQ